MDRDLRLAARRASVPEISYPEALPVSQKKDEILAAIRDHQVVIVAGETGSGKTTQLPKICLEVGRGVRGMVGHTQPRRRAARAGAPGPARRAARPRPAAEDRNIIPAMLDCARAYCTLYEIRHVLEEIYGNYREPVFF